MSSKNRKKFEACPNCNYQFTGVNNFCPNCGQENHDLNMPFGHVVLEVLEGTFHFDTKIFRTLRLLLFKPGQLTAEFIQNRRAPYVPPIRLYVFISFIFFLVMAADVLHKGAKAEDIQAEAAELSLAHGVPFSRKDAEVQGSVAFEIAGINSETLKTLYQEPDSRINEVLTKSELAPTPFKLAAARKLSKFLAADKEVQTHKFLKMLSVLMFLLMPLFALIMKSAYLRQKIRYIQFLIISLHYHCFVFILFTIAFLLEALLGWDGFLGIALLICVFYLLFEQRYLFRQSFGKTVAKTAYVSGLYVLNLALFMFLAAVLSIALI